MLRNPLMRNQHLKIVWELFGRISYASLEESVVSAGLKSAAFARVGSSPTARTYLEREIMHAYGSRRTYSKCIVLSAKAGKARKFQLTLKNHKSERVQVGRIIADALANP